MNTILDESPQEALMDRIIVICFWGVIGVLIAAAFYVVLT